MDSVLGNHSLDHFDVLVIGSGASGSAVAAMLCKHGQRVLVLEGGPNCFLGLDDPDPSKLVSRLSNDELKYRRYLLTPDPLVDPRTFRPAEAAGDRVRIGAVQSLPKTVGGGAVHADFATPRFMPADFQLGRLLKDIPGANFVDWPITYDQLEPFYLHAEYELGVQGLAGSHPFDPPRSGPYPMPPGVPMYTGERISQAAIQLGYHPFPVPMSINSRPYDGRPPCNDCGYCGGYGCPTHARGSPAVTLLRKALLSGNCQLWPDTRVVGLQLSGDKLQLVGVEAMLADGSRQLFRADRYVLAANAIEDVRLLLMSDPQGPGVGNSSGLVGRNLLFHSKRIAIGIFDE
ncbi:MAG: GMC family oxidoreductase N-terminal domain-containing protein, partial [Burkholderiales bacterium]